MATQITRDQGLELKSNPGFVLLDMAALAWDRACLEYGKQVLITDAWRSYETQERLFNGEKYRNQLPQYGRYRRGYHVGKPGFTADARWWAADGNWWTRLSGTAAAAVPGTSNHGAGLSVDAKTRREAGDPSYSDAVVFTSFDDPDRLRWLRIAAKHGWDDAEGRDVDEHWHLTWYRALDRHLGEKPAVPRAMHSRETVRATHVYDSPARGMGRLLPVGYDFTVWDGSAVKRNDIWWVQTTSGNWVRSLSTRRVE